MNLKKYISAHIDWHPMRQRCVLGDLEDDYVDLKYVIPTLQRISRIEP